MIHNTLKAFYILSLFCPLLLIAQQRMVISGKVVYGNYKTNPLLIVNVNAEKETYTDSLGNFTIAAHTGDLFAVSGSNIKPKQIRYTPDLVKGNIFTIIVQAEATQLDEVVINRSNISAESLGIVPKNQKTYTTIERRLATAGDFKPIHLLGLLAGSLQVDPIINAINGKTKLLKKQVAIEAQQRFIEKLKDIYTQQEITDKFKIPGLHTEGYLYYISEDEILIKAVNEHNISDCEFAMSRLASVYLEIIKNEK